MLCLPRAQGVEFGSGAQRVDIGVCGIYGLSMGLGGQGFRVMRRHAVVPESSELGVFQKDWLRGHDSKYRIPRQTAKVPPSCCLLPKP